MLRFISDEVVGNPRRQLEIILNNCGEDEVEPCSAVDSLYLQILDKAIPRNHESFNMFKTSDSTVCIDRNVGCVQMGMHVVIVVQLFHI